MRSVAAVASLVLLACTPSLGCTPAGADGSGGSSRLPGSPGLPAPSGAPAPGGGPSIDEDVAFLRLHAPIDVLDAPGGGKVVVSARWQGRVMTSAVEPGGKSLGFVHRAFIEAGKTGTPFDNLTLVRYRKPSSAPQGYVNSAWAQQEEPYAGDVVNSYNDGPTQPGAASLGGFYELESSSPAAALAPGESLEHVHTTLHVVADPAALDGLARRALGVSLAVIASPPGP